MQRRTFLGIGATALTLRAAAATDVAPGVGITALAFDAFALFDPRPVFQTCEQAFPGHGVELGNLWRARQFEYQWLRALGGRYQDFWQSARAALEFAARSLRLPLSDGVANDLMQGYLRLQAWPDVPEALVQLRRSGKKLALLSNATPAILAAGIRNARLDGQLHAVISTDRISTFKPDPRAYRLATTVLALRKEQIMFVPFAGWDVAGAKWYGYPTFWNNRQSAGAEELDAPADGAGESLTDLVHFLGVGSANRS